ncbi:hypothetical protein E2C01_007905 [Portunus trituberculatus]|uniref:Uncharacterized protein n=1 Tax=Portunus trituberculatus TaxID=210409 RepID=A0A5B7CZD8_PORTR|nr:hypothetical protein [Portunus trituberculatus]
MLPFFIFSCDLIFDTVDSLNEEHFLFILNKSASQLSQSVNINFSFLFIMLGPIAPVGILEEYMWEALFSFHPLLYPC